MKKTSGFTPVYKNALRNSFHSKKYLTVTFVIAAIIFAGIITLFMLLGKPDDEKVEFDLTKVYVYDETGLGVPEYNAYAKALGDENLSKVDFITVSDNEKAIKDSKEDNKSGEFVMIVQSEQEDEFALKVVSNPDCQYDYDNLKVLSNSAAQIFQYFVYEKAELSEEAIMMAMLPVTSTVVNFGDDEDGTKDIIEIIVFMGTIFIIYMVTIIYGQQVCTDVSIEKSSKLVEQLLVSVTPYGLVSGKVLGIITSSLIQFAIWIASIIGGVLVGDSLAASSYEGYKSIIKSLKDIVKGFFGDVALEPEAIVIAILLFLAAIVFYLAIAGFAGAFVTKPENAANVQIIFMLPIIISFFVVLTNVANNEGEVAAIFHYIPFTAAMITPGTMLVGSISVVTGLISFALLCLGSVLFLYLGAKVYKALLFFGGEKVTPKVLMKALRKK